MKNLKLKTLLIVLAFATCLQAQFRPRLTVLDEWAVTATNTVREGTIADVGQWQSTVLYIAMAVGNTTAHTDGTIVHIQTSPLDSGDDAWFEQASYTMGKGITGSSTTLDITPNAGSSTILINSATNQIGRLDDDGVRYVFVEDSTTVANSGIYTLVSHTTGAATSVTLLDGLAYAPGSSSTIWDWAETYVYTLATQTNRVRVVYDNTYDPDGAIIYTYSAIFGISP